MAVLDPELANAAWSSGDIRVLRRALASKSPLDDDYDDYFTGVTGNYGANILNLAGRQGRVEFVKEAIDKLPARIILKLLSNNRQIHGHNPLHDAAKVGELQVLRLMLGFYKSYSGPPLVSDDANNPLNKPWLAVSNVKSREEGERAKETPLHLAIKHGHEECAMELLKMDLGLVCKMVDEDGNSPLFLAVRQGFERVAEVILNSGECDYSLGGQDGSTALHVAARCSSGNVTKLLLKKHLDCLNIIDNEGLNVLCKWAKEGTLIKQLELTLDDKDFPVDARSQIFRELICMNNGPDIDINPLHLAMMIPNIDYVKELIDFYKVSFSDYSTPLWRMQTNNGDTPLHMALSLRLEHHALYFLELDSTLCEMRNNKGESPLLVAVREGCEQVVEKILILYPNPYYNMLRRNDGLTLLHCLKSCSEKTVQRLLGKFWWMINVRDDKGRTALDFVKEDSPWLVNLLVNPSLIQKEPFDWKTSCKRMENKAVLDFVHACNDLEEICRKESDTPLHHIKFETYNEYVNFLKIPSIKELKNITNREGATPLHIALKRKDINLAKALLIDPEVERNIVDNTGNTALGLLAELYQQYDEWEKMCKRINVNPYLKTTYIQSRTNLGEMRNTLSVVAALLATITFAAAFTLPGGLDSNTGYGLLAKKAPFLVFLLADTYAMCTSMLVLFCLIWSMISDRDMSYFLVDRSVLILMQSLYGTLLAFMTGIYAVIAHDSLWAAIIILVLCSLIGISVNRTVLREIITKLIPAMVAKLFPTSKKNNDLCIELLEEVITTPPVPYLPLFDQKCVRFQYGVASNLS